MRTFNSGATRDTDKGKPDYKGYLSALVIKRFGQYMLKHQEQKDGTQRSSDNWKKGIPEEVYVSSLARHHEDLQLYFEGFSEEMVETVEESLCAIIFNAQGLLYEILKENITESEKNKAENEQEEIPYWGC